MQKKIIALAIAGLASTAAFAQSNVTVYGLVDAAAYTSNGGDKGAVAGSKAQNYGFLSNAVATSRLGFKGMEDLGNGLKGVFNLETELSLATGQMGSSNSGTGAGTFSRAANVGATGGFGTVTLGRQATPTYAAVAGSDVLGANSGGLVNAWVYSNLKTGNRISGLASGLTNDAMATNLQNGYAAGIGYATPVFSGVQAKLFVNAGNGISGAGYSNNGMQDLGLSYDNAGIKLQATHQIIKGKDLGNAASAGTATVGIVAGVPAVIPAVAVAATTMNDQTTDQKNTLVAGSYAFGAAKLSAAWVKTRFSGAAQAADDIRTYSLGGTYKMGQTTLGLSYTNTKDAETSANKTAQFAALADYALSKRTSAYTLITRANNNGAATMNGLYSAVAASSAGTDMTSVAVGLKHAF